MIAVRQRRAAFACLLLASALAAGCGLPFGGDGFSDEQIVDALGFEAVPEGDPGGAGYRDPLLPSCRVDADLLNSPNEVEEAAPQGTQGPSGQIVLSSNGEIGVTGAPDSLECGARIRRSLDLLVEND